MTDAIQRWADDLHQLRQLQVADQVERYNEYAVVYPDCRVELVPSYAVAVSLVNFSGEGMPRTRVVTLNISRGEWS